MSAKPETTFRKKVREELEKLPNTIIYSIQQLSIRGTPDFLICCSGVFIALELKASKQSRLSKLQAYNLKRINDSRGLACTVYPENFEKIYKLISEISLVNHVQGIQKPTDIN